MGAQPSSGPTTAETAADVETENGAAGGARQDGAAAMTLAASEAVDATPASLVDVTKIYVSNATGAQTSRWPEPSRGPSTA
eukprot:g5650.t1